MSSSAKYNPEKIVSFFKHSVVAYANYEKRNAEMRKLELELERMGEVSLSKEFKKKLADTQRMVARTVKKEQRILSDEEEWATKLDAFHQRIHMLEEKLEGYLIIRDRKITRIKELEEKIQASLASKEEILDDLKKHLSNIEKIYRSAKKDGGSKKRLRKHKKQIERLKRTIKKVKK